MFPSQTLDPQTVAELARMTGWNGGAPSGGGMAIGPPGPNTTGPKLVGGINFGPQAPQPQFDINSLLPAGGTDWNSLIDQNDAQQAGLMKQGAGVANPVMHSGMRPGNLGLTALAGLIFNALDKNHQAGGQVVQSALETTANNHATNYQNELNAANAKRAALGTDLQVSQMKGKRLEDRQAQATNDNRYKDELAMRKDQMIAVADGRKQTQIQQAQNAYNNAKPGGLEAAANRWRMLDPENAPPPEAVKADYAQRTIQNNRYASQEVTNLLKSEYNNFGEVDGKRAAELEGQILQIAKAYDIPREQLPTVRVGATLRAKMFAEKKSEFSQKLTFMKSQQADKLANYAANRDLARQRIEQAQQRLDIYGQRDPFVLAQYNAQLRAWNANNKAANGIAEQEIGKLAPKRAGIQAALLKATDEKQRAKLQTQVDEMDGQIAYLRSTQQPTLEGGAIGEALGINGTPNPDYKPGGNTAATPVPPVPGGTPPNPNNQPRDARKFHGPAYDDPHFDGQVDAVAQRLGINALDLKQLMHFESGADAGNVNPQSGATGLIQFMPSTAKAMGTTVEALRKMPAVQQLRYVEKYLADKGVSGRGVDDVYAAILWPAAVGKPLETVLFKKGSKAYSQNSGLDVNHDGYITKGDAVAVATGDHTWAREFRSSNDRNPPVSQPKPTHRTPVASNGGGQRFNINGKTVTIEKG